jgi:hypothetical protein
VDGVIEYLNTDLDLVSSEDLTALAAVFEAAGICPLHVTHSEARWCACFETRESWLPEPRAAGPEPNIARMLTVVESLAGPLRALWDSCSVREFNIGYDCGLEPWAFNQGLSAELLGRMAAVGGSLRVTLYPDRGAGGVARTGTCSPADK